MADPVASVLKPCIFKFVEDVAEIPVESKQDQSLVKRVSALEKSVTNIPLQEKSITVLRESVERHTKDFSFFNQSI